MKFLKSLIKDERGQALSEYALLLGIILLGVIAVVTLLKDKIVALFTKIANALSI
ncbi:Flp family type IVb pilin [Oceanirhabdus sp. W0125-5]|uniref:Flp family type IVb pilin n=1 Tax=Oceanirhabdus sp. W0125-5 TaxID=2999116 RepID=UPI0022F2E916|nr:Flp family type IVb pilin [Oceanirhabdus sp. W0125-5]WBW95961.1 Flp family type IVb pilin [Oceanirhabdus sp. W0125-5]